MPRPAATLEASHTLFQGASVEQSFAAKGFPASLYLNGLPCSVDVALKTDLIKGVPCYTTMLEFSRLYLI